MPSLFSEQTRRILLHTLPILVAQLVSMVMPVIDTVLLGHFSKTDLAAVAVGAGIYVPVLLALAGILQAIAPVVAHAKGEKNDEGISDALEQTFYIALLLSIPGMLLLQNPEFLFQAVAMKGQTRHPEVEAKALIYMKMLSFGIPGALLYRTFYIFCNALGQPRMLVLVSLGGTLTHYFLSSALVFGTYTTALGAQGSGISNAVVNFLMASLCYLYITKNAVLKPYRLFTRAPRLIFKTWRELFKMGLPMGLSNFVEISAFAMTTLYIFQISEEVTGGHRLVANLASIAYMLPLAISIATVTQVGQSVGARDFARAKVSAYSGMGIAFLLSSLLAISFWFFKEGIITRYTNDPLVRSAALSLMLYAVLYQVLDALQTVAAFSLRGYKVTFLPMMIHITCFWGIGIAGGYYLAFLKENPMGASGFWAASVGSLIVAATLICGLLWRHMKKTGQ